MIVLGGPVIAEHLHAVVAGVGYGDQAALLGECNGARAVELPGAVA